MLDCQYTSRFNTINNFTVLEISQLDFEVWSSETLLDAPSILGNLAGISVSVYNEWELSIFACSCGYGNKYSISLVMFYFIYNYTNNELYICLSVGMTFQKHKHILCSGDKNSLKNLQSMRAVRWANRPLSTR